MFNISDLPRDPEEMLQTVLIDLIGVCASGKTTIKNLKSTNRRVYQKIIMGHSISQSAAKRLEDDLVREAILNCLTPAEDHTLERYAEHLKTALDLLMALRIDDHFLDPEMAHDFNDATLTEDDKLEIRDLMAKARRIVDISSTIPSWAKRNVLYHVSKIENELHREVSRFQVFLAAAADVSGLMNKVGRDVEPLADAIQKARTVTERQVGGYRELERAEEPKRLPKPDSV